MALSMLAVTARPQSILDLTEQLAIDAQKLSTMRATLKDIQEGYAELQQGYTRVRDLVRDNFNLHQVYLDALWILSPVLRSDPRLQTILNTEYRIVAIYQAASGRLGTQSVWSGGELTYISGTYSAVLERSLNCIDELTMITTDNQLRMTDDQRLAALDRIDGEIKSDLAFLQRFDDELAIEAVRRTREANDINTLKSLHGITP